MSIVTELGSNLKLSIRGRLTKVPFIYLQEYYTVIKLDCYADYVEA